MKRPIRFLVAVTAVVLLGLTQAVPARAQNVTTAGVIRGRIMDGNLGRPVADVLVTARNVRTGFERITRTGDDGFYVLRLLPPGTYDVTTRIIGYQPRTASGVAVTLGAASPTNFTLTTAAVALEALTVTAQPVSIDVSEGGVTQLVNTAELEELPSLGRDFVDFVNLSGLVAPDPGETTGGQFAIGGQRASQTSIQVDGVDANNSFFGENRGGSRTPFVFSLESIQELQIITNGFDVEHGQFSGGIVNVVTRSGTNEFEGTLYANFRDDKLTARPFIQDASDPEITTNYNVQQFSGRVSGPIIRDKAFFLLSVDGQRRREPQLTISQGRFGPGGAEEDPVVFNEVDRYFGILESQYGIASPRAGYNPFSTTNDDITIFGRIDWSLNSNHRLTLRHNFSKFSNDNEFNANFDFQYGRSRAEKIIDRSHSFVAELNSVLGDNTFNVLRLQVSNERRPRQGKDLRPTLTVNLSNGQRIRYGGTFASFNNNLEETKFQIIDNVTRIYGNHTIKVGGNFLFTHILNRFQNFGSRFQGAGEFVFANLDDFENFRPSSFFRPIQQGGGIPTSKFDVVDWAGYVQDEWRVTPKLTATLGLRYGQETFRDSPTPIVDVERAFGFKTGFAPTDADNVSPRLALAYDVNGDGRSVVRAGVGYFYGRVPGVVGGNVLQTERPIEEVICGGSIIDGDPDAPPQPTGYSGWRINGFDNPSTCASAEAGGVPTFTLWNKGFELPETIKANVGYERALGDRTRVSVDFLFSQSTNLYTVRNLNLRDAQFTIAGEGNRRVFTPEAQFDPTSGNSLGSRRNLQFSDVLVNFNDGRARSFITTIDASRQVSSNLNLTASYTFTKAWDNSPYSCCTAGGGYASPTTGAFGPNEIGGLGDFDHAWGRSDFARTSTFIATLQARLPLDFQIGAIWRSQSGRPWTVQGDDDINGDGLSGNDRAFIFTPENLPLASEGTAAEQGERDLYRKLLSDNDCVSRFQGKIIERNSCRFPWTHNLDIRVTKGFNFPSGQRAEIQMDLFNVLNGISRLFCDENAKDFDPTSGICGLGRVTGVFGSNQELLNPRGYDSSTGRVLYSVNQRFGQEDLLGSNLVLQFQAQFAIRFIF
ncbi:MAG: TonB-dependent receptor domain-containing protein [Gemmatimonadales bacterium]